jgi:ankyrin repeat protein
LAAYLGRTNIVEELIGHSKVDDGIERDIMTPLQMAAIQGHVQVMNLLVDRKANPQSISTSYGPVLNAAICSGSLDAVKTIVEKKVPLSYDEEASFLSPLSLAAYRSDLTMFEYLIGVAEKLEPEVPAREFSTALRFAARSGRVDVFKKLLKYQHSPEAFQLALDSAADEGNWEIATIILDQYSALECDFLFYEAATGSEAQVDLLDKIWIYTHQSVSTDCLSKALYAATDAEKESTVRLLLDLCHADPNATGKE